VQPLFQGLDSVLKRSHLAFQIRHPALEFFALDLLVHEEALDPPEPFKDRLVFLLQTFQPLVQMIEVAEDLAEAFVMLAQLSLDGVEAFVDGLEALIVFAELGLDTIEAALDLLELPPQEGDQVFVFLWRQNAVG